MAGLTREPSPSLVLITGSYSWTFTLGLIDGQTVITVSSCVIDHIKLIIIKGYKV